MTKILIVFGTRPEAIKMAPLIRAFKKQTDSYETRVCVTGQHRELLDQVLHFFEIEPDYDLQLMKSGQQLAQLSADVIMGMQPVLEAFKPDYLFVHGDTTTSTFAALAGFYHGVKICHVEAGLRTHSIQSPFPEEANRQLTARLTTFHFAPTATAKSNLVREGIDESKIFITGNTIIDALKYASAKIGQINDPQLEAFKAKIDPARPVVLVTCHRRENFGAGFDQICEALAELATLHDVQIVYPVHLNPSIYQVVHQRLGYTKNIQLVEPLTYPLFIWLMTISCFLITDSGGVQEEGTALGKYILLLRTNTERPEVISSGHVKIVGSDTHAIVKEATKLLRDHPVNYISTVSPYGEGDAAQKILEIMENGEF